MCGFAGILSLDSLDSDISRWGNVQKSLHKRGPDSSSAISIQLGDWKGYLGHVRLRIVDLHSHADQPFQIKNYTLLYNGEIYNYREIRESLEALGVHFSTDSDTEVLLRAYIIWGYDAFDKFDGMWALVIVDSLAKTIIMARDHFGEKPLFFATSTTPGKIAFASTAAALKTMDSSLKDCSQSYISEFLREGYSSGGHSIWSGVEKLKPGEIKTFEIERQKFHTYQTAPTPFYEAKSDSVFDIDIFENILINSLKCRLRADVPISLLLSGGIDSSYIATLAKQELGFDLRALTITDDIGSAEETDRASVIAKRLQLDHEVIDVKVAEIEHLYCNSLNAMDEPISDPSFPMLVELMSNVPQEIKVVLSGDGADELFLSYSNYRKIINHRPGFLPCSAKLSEYIHRSICGYPDVFKKIIKKLWRYIFLNTKASSLINDLLASGAENRVSVINEIIKGYNIDQQYYLMINAYLFDLSEYLLVKTDRASMYYSKEARSPFLNRQLQEYILSCSTESVGVGGKAHIIKRLKKRIGEDLDFKKRGFFASGQNVLPSFDAKQNVHPEIKRLLALSDFAIGNTTVHGYRARVLNDWLWNNLNVE